MTDTIDADILGLAKDVIDPRTDARCGFHVLYACQLVFKAPGSTVATLQSFSSREALAQGKQHVSLIQAQLPGLPEGDAAQWIYRQLVATDNGKNVLAGATPVREVL
jgi:hypothetical protein